MSAFTARCPRASSDTSRCYVCLPLSPPACVYLFCVFLCVFRGLITTATATAAAAARQRLTPIDLNSARKCVQNVSKMTSKLLQKSSKMVSKWLQNDLQNGLKMQRPFVWLNPSKPLHQHTSAHTGAANLSSRMNIVGDQNGLQNDPPGGPKMTSRCRGQVFGSTPRKSPWRSQNDV